MALTFFDGTKDFGGGVNSIKVTTIQSELTPDGLARNELAWLVNGTVRDGGVTPRWGWRKLGTIHDGSALYQGGKFYRKRLDTTNAAFGALVADAPAPNGFVVPNLSNTAVITTAAPITSNVGDHVIIYRVSDMAPFGEYIVVAIAGLNVTLQGYSYSEIFGWNLGGIDLQLFNPNTSNATYVEQFPELVLSIGGEIYRVNPEPFSVINQSTVSALSNPATTQRSYFEQAERWLIIQAGDGITLPLFWDGTTMRRSIGITDAAIDVPQNSINEIPAATCMDYYMGRLWYAQGRTYSAGDIVKSHNSGTLANNFEDSVLNVTESPLCFGGDGFTIPSDDGDIRALKHNAAIDASLGQGRLFPFTRKTVYSLQVPITRDDWIATTSNNQPLQSIVQLVNGAVNDFSVVAVNNDLYFQSLEPGIRSLMQTTRSFSEPGNPNLSAPIQRALRFNDRSLMYMVSGIEFEDRLWETILPKETQQGIAHQAVAIRDFLPSSSLMPGQRNAIWEGVYEGLDILQLFKADFGGRERAFAVVVSKDPVTAGEIQLWEHTTTDRFDNGDNRIVMTMETAAWTWADSIGELQLKKLTGCKLWVGRVYGEVMFWMQYRSDGETCWRDWHVWKICAPRTSCEDMNNPICYPLTEFGESYRMTMGLPAPPQDTCADAMVRPSAIGFQHQLRLTVKGFCRVRGIFPMAEKFDQSTYDDIVCKAEPPEEVKIVSPIVPS